MRTISVRLDDGSEARLDSLCQVLGLSQSEVVKAGLALLQQQSTSPAALAERFGLVGSFSSNAPDSGTTSRGSTGPNNSSAISGSLCGSRTATTVGSILSCSGSLRPPSTTLPSSRAPSTSATSRVNESRWMIRPRSGLARGSSPWKRRISWAMAASSGSRIAGMTSRWSGATQVCPALRPLPHTSRRAVTATSASSRTIAGLLPPSSRVTGVRWRAAAAITSRPMRPLPVKKMWSNRSSSSRAPTEPSPQTTRTVEGEKWRGTASVSRAAVAGASSEGLSTAVLPAARALISGLRQSWNG